MKPSQVVRMQPQHLMIFGDPKSGKSSLAAELLQHGYHLTWISMDNGHSVVFKVQLTPAQLDEQLNIIIIPDTKEFPAAIGTCLKIIAGKRVHICDRHGQVDCSTCRREPASGWSSVDVSTFGPKDIIVFDHIGQLANSAITMVMRKSKGYEETMKPEWEHYSAQGMLMDKFLTNVQQAPYNVICITHTTETEMEDGKKKLVPLVGTTPFSRNVGKYFDHIVYCDVHNAAHRFGSATTYKVSTVTGSRGDFKIEDTLQDAKPTLAIFFDGTVKAAEEQGRKVEEDMRIKKVEVESKVEAVPDPAVASPPEQQVVEVEKVVQMPAAKPSAAEMLAKLKRK